MLLAALDLTGRSARVMATDGPALAGPHGVLGVDVAGRTIEGHHWTVVQLLVDDDHPLLDRSLLDGPVVARVTAPDGTVRALEPFDHDAFRRRLHAERLEGESTTRGVLVLTDGELPPPYVRLAFLPADPADLMGTTLTIGTTTVEDLVTGAEAAHERGEITDDERVALLTAIDQRHPGER